MFNVLPDILKKDIIREYKLRFIIVTCVLCIFIQISFLILLVPSWVAAVYKEKDIALEVSAIENGSGSKNAEMVSKVITDTNAKLTLLDKELTYEEVLPLVNTIISKKNSSIRIGHFNYTALSGSTARVDIEGFSSNRESLVAFVKDLQATRVFSSVDLPVSNLAKDKNLNFAMSLTVSASSTPKK